MVLERLVGQKLLGKKKKKTLPETDWKKICIEMVLPKGLDFATYKLPQKNTLPQKEIWYIFQLIDVQEAEKMLLFGEAFFFSLTKKWLFEAP